MHVCIHEKHLPKAAIFPTSNRVPECSEKNLKHRPRIFSKSGAFKSLKGNGKALCVWAGDAVAGRILDVYNKNISRGVECRGGRKNSSVFAALFTFVRSFDA